MQNDMHMHSKILSKIKYDISLKYLQGPAINIKLESESVEIECNPYSYNNSMKKRVLKIKGKEKRVSDAISLIFTK